MRYIIPRPIPTPKKETLAEAILRGMNKYLADDSDSPAAMQDVIAEEVKKHVEAHLKAQGIETYTVLD